MLGAAFGIQTHVAWNFGMLQGKFAHHSHANRRCTRFASLGDVTKTVCELKTSSTSLIFRFYLDSRTFYGTIL